jgi:hypothetical protein
MRAGHTLNSIAHGKGIFTPESTPFDASRSVASKGFSDATNERSSAISEREVQGSLTRGAFSSPDSQETNEPGLNVSNPQCNITDRAEFSVYKTETPCNVMKLTDQDGLLDTTTNMMYFPLVKSEYMPEGRRLRDRAFWGESPVKDLLTYDPALFPGWCGKSASFAVWWDPRPHKSGLPPGGYIVSKFEHVDAKRKWSMYIGDGGIHSFGDPSVSIQTPTNFDWGVRRHVVLVFNHLTDKVCAYIDGAELGPTASRWCCCQLGLWSYGVRGLEPPDSGCVAADDSDAGTVKRIVYPARNRAPSAHAPQFFCPLVTIFYSFLSL